MDWRAGFSASSSYPTMEISTGGGIAGGLMFSYSPASCPEQWNGTSASIGGSYSFPAPPEGEPITIGLDVSNLWPNSPPKVDLSLGLGFVKTGLELPAEIHGGLRGTAGGSLSLKGAWNAWSKFVDVGFTF